MRSYWWAVLLSVIVLAWMIKSILSRPGPRMAFDRWLLTAPLVGKLVRGYNTVRFASTLAILTAAGVPILRALQAAGETLSNTAMRNNVDDAIVRVREGSSLSRALGNTKTFPPVLVHLIRSGEADRRRHHDAGPCLRRRSARTRTPARCYSRACSNRC